MNLSSLANDTELADSVRHELGLCASLKDSDIFVSVHRGTATLYGQTERAAQARLAETTALTVDGIVAVAQEVAVCGPLAGIDGTIAARAAVALERSAHTPSTVRVAVHNRILTLSGDVNWQYEMDAACRAVSEVAGIQGTVNKMSLRSDGSVHRLESEMAAVLGDQAGGLRRPVSVNANSLGAITITGTVSTIADRHLAEKMCWAVPGVTGVIDHLVVLP